MPHGLFYNSTERDDGSQGKETRLETVRALELEMKVCCPASIKSNRSVTHWHFWGHQDKIPET